MPILTVIDHEVLAAIARHGAVVMMTRSATDTPHFSTHTGESLPAYRIHRLIAAKKLIPVDDGLFPGYTQTYRLA